MPVDAYQTLYALYIGAAAGLVLAVSLVIVQVMFKTRDLFFIFLMGFAAIMVAVVITALRWPFTMESSSWTEPLNFGLSYLIAGIPVFQWLWIRELQRCTC